MPNKQTRPAPKHRPASGETNSPMQPIRIPVPAKIHTKRRPFCGDPTCPCHRDPDLIEEYLAAPFREGRLTLGSSFRTCAAKLCDGRLKHLSVAIYRVPVNCLQPA